MIKRKLEIELNASLDDTYNLMELHDVIKEHINVERMLIVSKDIYGKALEAIEIGGEWTTPPAPEYTTLDKIVHKYNIFLGGIFWKLMIRKGKHW
jgi:hypothetical protein